jgi:xanthine dehydrogenase YagR molybdenum-binding subunit
VTAPLEPRAIGTARARVDGPAKVMGTAPYAYEHPLAEALSVCAVTSPIARGRIAAVDASEAETLPGVVAVVTHRNAPRLASTEDRELAVLQSDAVHFRGQLVAAVVADTAEIAQHGADLLRIDWAEEPHDARFAAGRHDLYAPEQVNPDYPTDTEQGDVEAALSAAPVTIDQTYTTPTQHNSPMEPHTTVARWKDGALTLYDSTQGVHTVRETLAEVLGLSPDRVRVIAPYVGGGFGSKGEPHAHTVLAALAAQAVPGRPVKLAVTRRQMFSVTGYRTPTIQRIRLGAERDGRLVAVSHEVVEQTARIKEFAEQTAVPTRLMYRAENRRTTHRLAALDVPVPSWMRAPGETPGMFATEVAMDELAVACGVDPIELRVVNEPPVDPESGKPWSARNLVGCFREGARRFGWTRRDGKSAIRREGPWLVGTGVASSTYPAYSMPGTSATVRFDGDGRYVVEVGAADIGTGTWTVLAQIAADALACPPEAVRVEIGDTRLPHAIVEGGSMGVSCWGSAVVAAARAFRDKHGDRPRRGAEVTAEMPENPEAERFAMHSFGAQFAEVRVDGDTGEVRVSRMLGVFSVGRIVNPLTARSQLIGGMTMGLSMALHEIGVMDARFGHVVNHDLAGYHIASHADVASIDAAWLDESDARVNPMGARGIGEIGIVGAAAAIANATYDATGIRVRDLPLTPDHFLG